MKAVLLPDGKLVVMDQVLTVGVSTATVTFTHADGSTTAFVAASNAEATDFVRQIAEASDSLPSITLQRLEVSPSITGVAPGSVAHGANATIDITGVNMVTQAMIDNGEVKITINTIQCGINSSTPTLINVTVPSLTASGVPYAGTIRIFQSNYYLGADILRCSDATFLTIT